MENSSVNFVACLSFVLLPIHSNIPNAFFFFLFFFSVEEVTGEKTGRVNFIHFLQFVVRGQGDGDDPLEDIMQVAYK